MFALIMRCRLSALLYFAILLSAEPASAAEELEADDEKIIWTANNNSLEALPISIEKLFLTLHNTGILPSEPVPAAEFKRGSIESFARERTPIYNWTQGIDNLVCDLNPVHCSRPRLPIPNRQTKLDLVGHVGGFEFSSPSDTIWRIDPVVPIRLPDVQFRPHANWVAFSIPSNGNVRDLYETVGLGCIGAVHPALKFDLFGDMAELRQRLADLSGLECPKFIAARQQVSWSVARYDHLISSSKTKDPTMYEGSVEHAFRESQADLSKIYGSTSIADAWEVLGSSAARTFAGSSQPALITLPVMSVAATLAGSKIDSRYVQNAGKDGASLAPDWAEYIQRQSAGDRFRSIAAVLSVDQSGRIEQGGGSDGSVSIQGSVVDQTIFDKQKVAVFDPINHSAAEVTGDPSFPRTIIFIDDSLANDHCVFTQNCTPRWLDKDVISATTGPNKETGELLRKEFDQIGKSIGHGTGVAAVALAQPKNGAMVGVDPSAKRLLFKADLQSWNLAGFKEKVEKLTNTLLTPDQPPPGYLVWNLSGHTVIHERARSIDLYLQRFQVKRLPPDASFFVFAAGNEDVAVVARDRPKDECMSFPACWSKYYRNVITVVGVMKDKDGNLVPWLSDSGEKTSYLNSKFEIAAMADDIVIPSLSVKGFYAVEGTSYAAPQVAAVVAALRSRLISPPELVEARLMACGSMTKSLIRRVAGGVLDVNCSMKFRKSLIAFRTAGEGDILATEAAKLRPADLKGIWTKAGKRDVKVDLNFPHPSALRGAYNLWPELFTDSIIGIRRLVDDEDKFKIATLNADLSVDVEVRPAVTRESGILLEVQFDGEDKARCISIEQIISFVPAVPEEAGGIDGDASDGASCEFVANP
ncbi:S8 family serine peptidase [Mesorhizobium sp.]|uniref:S8 family serine peptidase n=1 Tax=Mesorhizobium sp. TaxID=1871066 RepID=UPI000FEA86B4|nr:S8 family serine peptidase [Mesorhizobium sp.]RWE85119.1 MAG: hypothetical protein EOS49_18490 [Mesorhizobium sp.]